MMKKKVVLIGIYLLGIYPRGDDNAVAHLLAPAFLKSSADADPVIKDKYDIEVLNIPISLSEKEIVQIVLEKNPDIIGFSTYIWNFEVIYRCSKLIYDTRPALKIILGGPQVSFNPIEIMEAIPQVSFIIAGTGETRFKKLLLSEFDREKVRHIPGITFKNEKGILIRNQGNVTEDLTKIPSPYKTGIINLDTNERNCVFIETFRGCIFECGYCYWMGEQKKKINCFPIEQILDDIEIIYNHPNVASVVFTDACLFYTKKRAKLIIDKIASCSRKIPTILTLDIAFFDAEIIKGLSKIDLSHQKFHFGMQSMNQETLKLMNRRIGPELIKKRISLLREIDPDAEVSFDLIYGLPGDNHEIFRETVDFALNLSPIKLNLSPLVLLPGSPYWAKRKELGFDYSSEPPYHIRSNKTYSATDMKKTRKLVLGIIMVMYFPAIRNAIYEMCKAKAHLKRICLFEEFVEMFEEKSKIVFDYIGINDDEQCSAEIQNRVRRKVMNQVAQRENCLIAYETMMELLRKYGLEKSGEKVLKGIEFYSQARESILDKNVNLLCSIKCGWVVSNGASENKQTDVLAVS